MKRAKSRIFFAGIGVLAALLLLCVFIAWPRNDMIASTSPAAYAGTPANIARGAYLSKAGNCMACHTTRGGVPYAGGRALETPFGRVMSPNITSDPTTGIGAWTPDDFWNALHNGKARDGRLLYPAFPYTSYTKVTRGDADALYAYLRTVAPHKANRQPHALRFPYNQQFMLAGWRLLYFTPGVYTSTQTQSNQWNRGAYLVEGLGHCAACHSSRNSLGASEDGLKGGMIETLGWYAPALDSAAEAGLGNWDLPQIVALLKTGVSERATVAGPMAHVVGQSLQHVSNSDVTAMAVYLKSLTPQKTLPPIEMPQGPQAERVLAAGKKTYEAQCIQCHGSDGKGLPPHYPPLAGNRALTMNNAANPIRIILNGGFAPTTGGNPRPYGMPPYSQVLDDQEIANVVSYMRASWGNRAPPVTSSEVNRYRGVLLD